MGDGFKSSLNHEAPMLTSDQSLSLVPHRAVVRLLEGRNHIYHSELLWGRVGWKYTKHKVITSTYKSITFWFLSQQSLKSFITNSIENGWGGGRGTFQICYQGVREFWHLKKKTQKKALIASTPPECSISAVQTRVMAGWATWPSVWDKHTSDLRQSLLWSTPFGLLSQELVT